MINEAKYKQKPSVIYNFISKRSQFE